MGLIQCRRRSAITSPLILLVFIASFSAVLSRHHIRHHRDRFKRQQGAHLFLAGSYVYDGGEGPDAGPWTEWSAPSPCSRSCGGGVSTEQRQCHPGYTCQGPTTRHVSCNTQDCPDLSDFRAHQCSEFDSVPFEGVFYQWIPYTKAPNPCELNCMPRGERFYYRHKSQVIDGTRCNDESFDVCVQGTCRQVGCDMMLGSNAREDKCRRCGGDGSTCNTVTGRLDMQDLQTGYNDILLIPAGATNIDVHEIEPSNNYLAIRNTSGHYYLNGNWRIDFPRSLEFAGCRFYYSRYPQEFSAPDKIVCLGPTDEALFVVLLSQDRNVGVDYEYSLPTNIQPGSETETYAWTFDQFTPCTATCGGGVQYRNVTCAGRRSLEPADRGLCDASNEPPSSQKCGEVPCEAQWVPYPWGNCSAPCGEEGGIQRRDVTCQQVMASGYSTVVPNEVCERAQPKPADQQRCNQGRICAKWHLGPWKPCDHLCGDGKETRAVTCFRNDTGQVEALEDAECEAVEARPEAEKACNLRPCEGVDWITSEWSGCDKCGLTNETRKAQCATSSGQVYADDLCEKEQKPELVRQCKTTNETCEYLWYASQWSECSAKCGEGVQTRTLFCGAKNSKGDVTKVEDSKCESYKTYDTIKKCQSEVEKCPGEWFSGPWTECSKECGGGVRTKKVVCLKDNQVVSVTECGSDDIVFSEEDCNKQPCSADTIIPTDVTKSVDESEKRSEPTGEPMMTSEPPDSAEYEIVPDDECEDGEWVDEEEGEFAQLKLETEPMELGSSTEAGGSEGTTETPFSMDDLMMSDGTASTGESEVTSSGDGADELTSPSSLGVSGGSSSTDLSGSESTVDEGSGDTSDTSESGTESTVFRTDIFETDTSIDLGSSPFSEGETESSGGSTESSGGSTESSGGSTESSGGSTESSGGSTESSGGSTESSGGSTESSGGSTESSGGSTESSGGSTDSSGASSEAGSTESASGASGASSDVTTELSASSESGATSEQPSSSSSSSSASSESSESTSEVSTESTSEVSTESTSEVSTESTSEVSTESTSEVSTESTSEVSSESTSEVSTSEVSTESTVEGSSEASTTASAESSGTPESSAPSSTEGPDESTEKEIFIGESEVGVKKSTKAPEGSTVSPGSTESGTEGGSTESSSEGSTEAGTGVSTEGSTESGTEGSTEGGSTEGGSTESVTTEGGTTEGGSSTEGGSTEGGSTEGGSTESATKVSSEGSTEGSTEGGTAGSTESSSEVSSGSSTEGGTEGSTESTTEFTGSTESTTEFTGSTEFDIWSSTTESGATDETSTDLWGTTPIIDIFTKKQRMCKRRKEKDCKKSKFGCCWDSVTPAEGPFDKGCPTPKTCAESKFGCCEDGVSPALGRKFKGCPSTHCNETLFGCCPDNKTAAEGNNEEGCPPPPPACLKAKYGCCDDNVTEAKGPKQKGCEPEEEVSTTPMPEPEEDCNNTTFGCCPDGVKASQGENFKGCDIFKDNCTESYFRCCPDGVTSAKGPNYQGCKTACDGSPFGCCPDGVTPAHGHSGEGCCLAAPHGCCPDNVVPARGPNLEGCGCQYSPYGCCPDNTTTARGRGNEGCGCQHTEHGCCPDGYTPAPGADYEGCLCHTFQFGCCPDGVTVAKGPHQQGCGCRNTEFGCCSDDSTPAQGPEFQGCGCDSTKFGCCPDGTTEAKGENFEGCEDIPVNYQDSCTQPKERGSCRNYTVKWFFDSDYGGCSRFWYGGCDGNGNRFRTKEECDGICVKPEGTDRCKLPKIPGPCEGYYPQWFYDKERRHCAQFVYGGCLGNNNRFETREECSSLCVKDDSVDACEQEKDDGPCRGQYRRWFFDKATESCQQFVYGGCKANNNNFPTEEACKQQCAQPGRKKDHCSLPRAQGNCTAREPRWYYDIPERRCLPFYYSGCNGNDNNFNTREACETDCPKEIEKDLCQLAAETGSCGNYTDRWYFDTREKACRQFYYGGCGGNGNNFQTQQECDRRCQKRPEQPEVQPPEEQEPFQTNMCLYPKEAGTCQDDVQARFFYDRDDGVCKSFAYGGCGGNRNNFATNEECLQYCGNAQDLCGLPPVVGPCSGEYEQFYYDSRTDSCQAFNYGGCGGNYNRFQDQASCEQRCRRARPTEPTLQTQAPPAQPQPGEALCYDPADAGNCTDSQAAFFFDADTRTCTPFTYTGCGGNGNRFNSEEQCERQCGSFRGQDVCNLDRDPGPCRGYFIKYYYDRGVGRCGAFVFGGCGGNGNRFSSAEECEQICVTHEETRPNATSSTICRLPVDGGSCEEGYHKRWYFDDSRGECIAFIFTGCGGNFNNFKTFQSCEDTCREFLVVTPPPVAEGDHPCQAHFDECATLRCAYGIEAFVDANGCNRCQCHNPCGTIVCPESTQCAIDINRNRTTNEDPNFIAVCREVTKEGQCPPLQARETCEEECRTDAECPLDLKCCSAGCSTACVQPVQIPAEYVTHPFLPAYTEAPSVTQYYAPQVDVETYEPEVHALIGDQATLRCAVTGNPTPRISWKRDDLIIDGTQAKYRIKLDQSLQIITLHKTDSGIYLCTADNSIGEPITNEIKLEVLDSEPRPATVLDQEDQPNLVVSLNAPATLNCLAMGYPFPAVTWWKEDSMIPLKTSQFEVRKDYSLLIHSVKLSNLGIYTCQAYNGVGKAASWSVIVKAKGPYYTTSPDDEKYLRFIVNPPELPTTEQTYAPPQQPQWPPYVPAPQPSPPPPYYPPSNNEIPPSNRTEEEVTSQPEQGQRYPFVPVTTNITMESQRYPVGSDVSIPCIVDGYPKPQVQWYKDGVPLYPTNRIHIREDNMLTVQQATKADSGLYQCEAANIYSKSESTVTIQIDGMYIHPSCKDNKFFAKCSLIVKHKYCNHEYYARFCCRSCTEAGLLPVDGPHLRDAEKHAAISENRI